MSTTLPDQHLLLLSLASCTIIYSVVRLISTHGSPVPLLVSVFVFSNMISRTALFKKLARKVQIALADGLFLSLLNPGESLALPIGGSAFSALSRTSQLELLQAISSLEAYEVNSIKINDRRRSLYRLMSWKQQKLCDEAGYSQKLKRIDAGISKNQSMFSSIADAAKEYYGISNRDLGILMQHKASKTTSSSNYRVVESMGHFIRDWVDSDETSPLLEYVKKQLDSLIPPDQVSKTCIVVPGSGLGRIAHEISTHKEYGSVHAVEFSGLMHCCNNYVYQKSSSNSHQFQPYVNSTSNFLTTEAEFRKVSIPAGIDKPANLHLHLDDFCAFEIPNSKDYENVVVVSVFFIDTAENILDYFDKINQLCAPSRHSSTKNGYWINVGPLKYGSAAQAELNGEEIALIRKTMGWKDRDVSNSLDEEKVFPYITDKQSLWQGFYGITRWCCSHRDNRNKFKHQ